MSRIYSQEIELSIIEYRLKYIFSTLEKHNLLLFPFAIIYNESFWQLNPDQREQELLNSQNKWMGEYPEYMSYFAINHSVIDKINLSKALYASYYKIKPDDLKSIFLESRKEELYGFLNTYELDEEKLVLNILNIKRSKFKHNSNKIKKITGKSLFEECDNFLKDQIKLLIITYYFNFDIWETFLKKIKKSQKKYNIDIIFISKLNFDYFTRNYTKYPNISQFINQQQINYDYINIYDLKITKKYDYIFLDGVLSALPAYNLRKKNKSYYSLALRILYNPINYSEEKHKEIIDNIRSKLLIPIDEELIDLITESTWINFQDKNVIDFIEEYNLLPENYSIVFPFLGMNLLISLLDNLESKGIIKVIDHIDIQSLNSNSLIDENLFFRNYVNYKQIKNITQKLYGNEIKISFSELFNSSNSNTIVSIKTLISLIEQENKILLDFINPEIIKFKNEVEKISKKYSFFEYFYKKKIFLLGLELLLYYFGYSKFIKQASNITQKYYNKNFKISKSIRWIGNYEKELVAQIIVYVFTNLEKNHYINISLDNDEKINNQIKSILDSMQINSVEFLNVIYKYKNRLLEIKEKENYRYGFINVYYEKDL